MTQRRQIRRQIQRTPGTPAPLNPQARILSGLNVLSVLENNAPKYLQDVLCYGPASFSGENWASALVWFRPMGLNQHGTLTLFGAWAVAESELLIGTKTLKYSAPVFNTESYHRLIKQGFSVYYGDKGTPPLESDVVWRGVYEETRRLALRRELADALVLWLRQHMR